MVNQRFGRLLVIEPSGTDRFRQIKYKCACDCGNVCFVLAGNLKKGNSKSCGCARQETCSKRMSVLNRKHGKTNTKVWRTWKGILERTTKQYSQHYRRYGANGIGLYKDWHDFQSFLNYIGNPPSEHHSIDRIDNSKGYEPGNVRWATPKEQARNRSTNIYVSVDGEILCLTDAAVRLGISKSTAARWIKKGRLSRIEKQKP